MRSYFNDHVSAAYEFKVRLESRGYVLEGGGADLVRLEILRQREVGELAVRATRGLGESAAANPPCQGDGARTPALALGMA